jgi:hypothetical protein
MLKILSILLDFIYVLGLYLRNQLTMYKTT